MPAGPITVTALQARSSRTSRERSAQLLELAHAVHERAARRTARPDVRLEAEQPPGLDLGGAALQRERLQRLGLDELPHERVGVLPEQDLALGSGSLEPRRDVERVAGGERRSARAGAEEHLAGLDAELHRDSHSALALQLGAQRGTRLAQLDRGSDGAQRVVLVQLGQPEDADHGVADEALDGAAVPFDHGAADLGVAVEQGVHRLRVEPLAETRGADEVGEDDAHEPTGAGRAGRGSGSGGLGRLGRRLSRWSRLRRLQHRQRERRVLRQDRSLQLPQPLARLDAELLDQLAAGLLVGLQRVGLAVGAIQGEHQLRAQALAERVLGDQRLELSDHLGVPAERQPRVDLQLQGRRAQVGEARDVALGERLVGEIGERLAAPEREAFVEPGGGLPRTIRGQLVPGLREQPLEPVRVEPVGVELQAVPALPGHDQVAPASERLAQPRDMDLHGLGRRGRRLLAPELLDQPVGAERLVGVQHEHGEQRALLAPSERDFAALVEDLERSEDAEVHSESGTRAE